MCKKMMFVLSVCVVAMQLLCANAMAAMEPTPVESSQPAAVQPTPEPAVAPVPSPVPALSPTLSFTPANVADVVTCRVQSSENVGDCLADDIAAGICACFPGCSVRQCNLHVRHNAVTRVSYVVTKPCCKPVLVRVLTKGACDCGHECNCGREGKVSVVAKHI